ncbi:hypothetical protein VWI13_01685 [Escherichia coli O157]|nr:hypothetical protein [Escherichia coli O157]
MLPFGRMLSYGNTINNGFSGIYELLEPTGTIPSPMRYPLTCTDQTYIYCTRGTTTDGNIDGLMIYRYNPVLNDFSTLVTIDSTHNAGTMEYYNGRMYIFGGSGPSELMSVYGTDGTRYSWGSSTVSSVYNIASCLVGSKMYVFGGNVNKFYIIDLDTKVILTKTMPSGYSWVMYCGCVAYNEKTNSISIVYGNDLYIYNVSTEIFTKYAGSVPVSTTGSSNPYLCYFNERIYLFRGGNVGYYDTNTNSWVMISTVSVPSVSFAIGIEVISDGKTSTVYTFFGGTINAKGNAVHKTY